MENLFQSHNLLCIPIIVIGCYRLFFTEGFLSGIVLYIIGSVLLLIGIHASFLSSSIDLLERGDKVVLNEEVLTVDSIVVENGKAFSIVSKGKEIPTYDLMAVNPRNIDQKKDVLLTTALILFGLFIIGAIVKFFWLRYQEDRAYT